MLKRRTTLLVAMVGAGVLLIGSIAGATGLLEAGSYTLTLPGVGPFEFTVDTDGGVVEAVAAPEGYEIDDDDPEKASWKDYDTEFEVEAKSDKVEADVTWGDEGKVTLGLPGGGSITVTAPDGDGAFTVSAAPEGVWFAFGDGSDWYVANAAIISTATTFFKVEADEDGVEIKAVDAADDGFLNDLEDEEEVEVESDDDGEGKGKAKGPKDRGDG